MSKRRFYRHHWLLTCLICLSLLLPGRNFPVAYAEPSAGPTVSYASLINTIYIGNDSGSPSSQPISVPTLANVLATQDLALRCMVLSSV